MRHFFSFFKTGTLLNLTQTTQESCSILFGASGPKLNNGLCNQEPETGSMPLSSILHQIQVISFELCSSKSRPITCSGQIHSPPLKLQRDFAHSFHLPGREIVMANWKELTKSRGVSVFVNLDQVAEIEVLSNSTKLIFAGGDHTVSVTQSPTDIFAARTIEDV